MENRLWTESKIEKLQRKLSEIWEDLAFEFVPVLESTNTLLKERIKAGRLRPPFLLLAGEQTAGRGRRDRGWYSPPDEGLYFSLLLKSDIPQESLYLFTVISSLSAHGALDELGYSPALKWPNDILLSGSKVAGILSELITCPDGGKYVIVGMGINSHMATFPSQLKDEATSLYLKGGSAPSPVILMQELLVRFRNYYKRLSLPREEDEIRDDWVERLDIIDRRIKFRRGGDMKQGKVVDLSQRGELIVECGQECYRILAGDIDTEAEAGEEDG